MVRRSRNALLGLFAASLLLGVALVVMSNHAMRWRAQLLWMKAAGDIPGIPTKELVGWLSPGSAVYLEALTEQPSLNASVRNLNADSAEFIAAGRRQFQVTCSHCHGADGTGGSAPNLLQFIGRTTDWEFLSVAKWGRSGTAMAAQPVDDKQIWQIHSYLRDQARVWAKEGVAVQKPRPAVDVPYEKIANARAHPGEWFSYNGDHFAQRYSALDQINRGNVSRLQVAWTAQLRPSTKPLSATPVVAGGMIFVTEAPDGVVALEAKTGAVVWRFRRPIDPAKLPLCCGAFNRGVSVLGTRVFVATLDARLLALDAATGDRLWETQVADPAKGYSMTNAPMVVDGHLVVGVAGGEFGIRGFVAAFSPDSGKKLWQFDAIPAKGEPGNETWAGDSWKVGGASTWTTGAYDKELDLIYWTTGNPWPPLDGRGRQGDNLYSNSLVALDRKTGKLKWHYQFTPHDVHDWDSTQQPVLAEVTWKGERVPAVILANRNAFYYVIDRRDGRFLFAKPFVKQTWATGFDAKGRPTRDPASEPSPKGTLVWPWMHGGTNWWSPSYDPARKLHFVPTVDAATLYFSIDMTYQPATMTMGGTTRLASNQPAIMAVKAIDPDTGATRWSTRLDKGDFHQFSRIAGLLSTAGGVVFAGFEDRIVALDSDSGEELWRFSPGGLTNAGSATYLVDGTQYYSMIAGNVLYAFRLPSAK